jgi:hypothetical protein
MLAERSKERIIMYHDIFLEKFWVFVALVPWI